MMNLNVSDKSIRLPVNRLIVGAFLLAGLTTGVLVEGAPGSLPARMEPVMLDSGPLENLRAEPAVLYSRDLDLGADVPWVRVLFDKETTLAPGSFIRVTSLLDGETQILDAQELENWGYGTAFFNGSEVKIEVIGGAEAKTDRVRISEVFAGTPPDEQRVDNVASICTGPGGNDDRILEFDAAVGRLLPGDLRAENSKGGSVCVGGTNSGNPCTTSAECPPRPPLVPQIDAPRCSGATGYCTAWIEAGNSGVDKRHLTAGHCFSYTDASGVVRLSSTKGGYGGPPWVLEFKVPASNRDCTVVHPPVNRQFPVDLGTIIFRDNVVGDDWGVFKCLPNVEGLTTYEKQGAALVLRTQAVTTGSMVRVTGYGADGTDLPPGGNDAAACTCTPANMTGTRNAVLQTQTGPLLVHGALQLDHQVDTCFQNSGSPIIFGAGNSRRAIGIHTHGGCQAAVNPTNSGTAVSNPNLQGSLTGLAVKKIPAVSEWGLVVLTLLLLTGIAHKFGRRAAVQT